MSSEVIEVAFECECVSRERRGKTANGRDHNSVGEFEFGGIFVTEGHGINLIV